MYLSILPALTALTAVTQTATFLSRSSTYNPFSPSFWPLPHNVTGDGGDYGGRFTHDPSIIKHNGICYSFTAHQLVGIGKSPTLSGYWRHSGRVLFEDSIINLPGRNNTWVPDAHQVGDTLYLCYSVSTFGSQSSAIGLATSKELDAGTWTDHGIIFESGANTNVDPSNITNAIDPNLFVDPKTNVPYLTYWSFYADIWQLRLYAALKKS